MGNKKINKTRKPKKVAVRVSQSKPKILVTSAGGANGMNVLQALYRQKEIPLCIYTSDTSNETAAAFISDKHFVLPSANNPEYLKKLETLIKKEKIDIILPMHSAEVYVLSKNQTLLNTWGAKSALSPFSAVETTWDKNKTADFFKANNIPHPEHYAHNQITKQFSNFPLFAKPISASGSKNCRIINNYEDFSQIKEPEKYIFQQYIEGIEYTIDALGDLAGKIVDASPRIRVEVRGGLAVKALTVKNPILNRYSKKIIESLGAVGPVNIQCIIKNKKIYFIEVNTRFASGGLPLAVAAGFNIPLLIIKMLLNKPLGKIKIQDNMLMVRYYDALFAKKKGNKYHFDSFFHEFN